MDQAPATTLAPPRMDRETYRAWAAEQPRRHELLDGVPVRMNPERWGHAAVKGNIYVALRRAVEVGRLPCQVIGDGFTVEIGDRTDFEPDAMVNCGERMPSAALAATNPVIVVEVLSRSTRSIDVGTKLSKYFEVPSIRHHLIVEVERRRVIHHRRDGERITSDTITSGSIECDPPGLAIMVDDIYEEVTE